MGRILLVAVLVLIAGALVLLTLLGGTNDEATRDPGRAAIPEKPSERSLIEPAEEAEDRPGSPDEGPRREEIGSAAYFPVAPRGAIDPRHTNLIGRVVDEDGSPVGSASVVLLFTIEDRFHVSGTSEIWDELPDTTSANGSFLFENVSAHGFELTLRASARGRPAVEVRCPFPVGGGTTEVGSIVLSQGGFAYGWVLDASGNPVPGAEVVWRSVGPVASRLVRVDVETRTGVETDEEGFFVVEGLPLGLVHFAAVAEGLSCEWTHPYRIAIPGRFHLSEVERELERLGYELVGGVKITMEAGLAVRGELIDRDSDQALVGRISARPYYADERTSPTLSTTSGTDGRFELTGLVPGADYLLHAHSPGYKRLWRGESVLGKPLADSDSLTLALERAESVRVHVRDGETLEPVEGAELGWVGTFSPRPRAPTRLAAVTDSDGNATVAPIEVEVSLQIRASGYAKEVGRGVQPDGRALYELYRGRRLHVDVVDDEGPVGGAIVELRASWTSKPAPRVPHFEPDNIHMPLFERLVSDRRGRVAFRRLPGRARVLVDAGPRGSGITGPIVIGRRSEDDVQVEVRVHPAARIGGVVRLEGEGLRGQRVVAIETLDRGPGITFGTESGEDGRYQLEGLPPGRFFVCAILPSRTPDMGPGNGSLPVSLPDGFPVREVELAPGQTVELDLRADPPQSRLFGTLTIDGAPGVGYGILAELEEPHGRPAYPWMGLDEGNRAYAETDDRGWFDMPRLHPGLWKVTAHRILDEKLVGSDTFEVLPGKAVDASMGIESESK